MDKDLQEAEAWNNLRPSLNNIYDFNPDWDAAINLFKMRLYNKFVNPINLVISKGKLEGEGFAVTVLLCSMIEGLASFRTGQIFNHKKNSTSPNYEYNQSKKLYINFLRTAKVFENNFWKIENNLIKIDSPFSADDFYTNVRCGLIHEARTKSNWYINATTKDVRTEKVFIEAEGSKVKLLRAILFFCIKDYIADYCEELKNNSQNSKYLRRFFGRKMDNLFDISPDPDNYEWWIP